MQISMLHACMHLLKVNLVPIAEDGLQGGLPTTHFGTRPKFCYI
jgi:hypothetical protein